MTDTTEGSTREPGVFYIAVAALPAKFDRIEEWVEVVLRDHPHMLGMRGVIDCSRLPADVQPPTVEYLTRLAHVLEPLMKAARCTRCAIIVGQRPFLWRARLFESMTSGSRIAFKSFQHVPDALAWLREDLAADADHLDAG